MPADSDDDALADIEAGLASDRAFVRRVAGAQAMMGAHAPSWSSLATSALLLLLSVGLLVADVRFEQPWLMIPCVVVFAVAIRPVMISMSGHRPSGDDEHKS